MSDSETKSPQLSPSPSSADDLATKTADVTLNADESAATAGGKTEQTDASGAPQKIEILLKAVGNAPILKKKKFLLDRAKNMHYITNWLKNFMKMDAKEQLFLYVNQEFAPSPDTEVGTIYDCFRVGNTVIFHYATTPAWG